MEKFIFLVSLSLLSFSHLVHGRSEEWGYVLVRPKAHMFWWHYKSPYRVEDPLKPWPIILWLQGGPGASGVGLGNFEEIGPLDAFLKPRNSTWLKMADLLFVDNPIGIGYSFVEEDDLVVKSDVEAAADLTTLGQNEDSAMENREEPKREIGKRGRQTRGNFGFSTNTCRTRDLLNGKFNGLV